jgi:hypothetical protein
MTIIGLNDAVYKVKSADIRIKKNVKIYFQKISFWLDFYITVWNKCKLYVFKLYYYRFTVILRTDASYWWMIMYFLVLRLQSSTLLYSTLLDVLLFVLLILTRFLYRFQLWRRGFIWLIRFVVNDCGDENSSFGFHPLWNLI